MSGTENRIAIARQDYNEAAEDIIRAIRRFPTNIIANIFGFERVDYFEAQEGVENVPKLDFSKNDNKI